MSKERTSVQRYLPARLSAMYGDDPPWREVYEVRVRVGAPLTLTTASGRYRCGDAVTQQEVYDCYLRCCGHAVHTHEEELQQGFVTTSEGFRVGIGGTAVVRGGAVRSYRDVTSLCIRIPRRADGCSLPLLPFAASGGKPYSMLVCGAPGSGKTTLLRDLALQLSAFCQVCVVDERSELSAGGLPDCDVLRGTPKAQGILQAIRTLSPDAVIVDELGDEREWQAVLSCCYCGVAVVASAHMTGAADVRARPAAMKAIGNGGFARVAFLPPRTRPEDETTIWEAKDVLAADGHCSGRVRLRGSGGFAGGEIEKNGNAVAGVGAVS